LNLAPCIFFPTAVSIAAGRRCLQAEELKLNCEIWSTYILMTQYPSKAAGERVMEFITSFLEKRLRLRVNEEKSAVGRPWERKFLGYLMTWHKRPKLKVASASIKRAKAHIREIMRKGRGRSLTRVIGELTPYLRGWVNYFRLSSVKRAFEELDEWLRRKLRCILWRQWKKPRTRARKLMERGIEKMRPPPTRLTKYHTQHYTQQQRLLLS